jgi:RNA polymerase sigma factor (sigma-70 family)
MADGRLDRVQPQVYRLFQFGAVGTLSDAQLLDRFVTRRDASAEAAFAELVNRHGPMVLRVSRSVLHDRHDAEDAFQAVFLILANRAGSIRRKRSVASWLFGVAHRVATRARRASTRRQLLVRRVAAEYCERTFDAKYDPDLQIIHEAINCLPERLRAPIVLCYLQGLTYAAAAQQLGLSETAVRGRLARARERLSRDLTRRGVTASAGLLAAGAARQAEAAIPLALNQSTIRIALGFVAGNAVAALVRGVLISMLMTRLRTAAIVIVFGVAGTCSAWQAAAGDGQDQAQNGPAAPNAQVTHAAERTIVNEFGQATIIEPAQSTRVFAASPGYIERVHVRLGDKVKKGDVLATILPPKLHEKDAAEAEKDQWLDRRADNRIKLARKTLELAEAELNAARQAIHEAEAVVVKCDAEVDRWDTEVKRLERDTKRGIVDPQVLLESNKQLNLKVAARNAAHTSVANRAAEVTVKRVAVEKAKLELSIVEENHRIDGAAIDEGEGPDAEPRATNSALPPGDGVSNLDARIKAARARLAKALEMKAEEKRDFDRWQAELKQLREHIDEQVRKDPGGATRRASDGRTSAQAALAKAAETARWSLLSISKADVERTLARAALAIARIERTATQESARRITITAPHDGVIIAQNAKALDFVKPPTEHDRNVRSSSNNPVSGSKPLFLIDRMDTVRVLLDVPGDTSRYVHLGTKASVQIKGLREAPIETSVARILRTGGGRNVAARVEIDLPNPGGELRFGMYVYAKLLIDRPGVRALPVAAVRVVGDKSFCWLLEAGRPVRTEIETGLSDGQWIEVKRRAGASPHAGAETSQWHPWDGSEQILIGDLSSLK